MNFYIMIKNRIAEVLSDNGRLPLLVCGNTDNCLVFTFDEEWSEYTEKTARFVYREDDGRGSFVYSDIPFRGNRVTVPYLRNVKELWVGVIAGDRITTSAARLSCVSSICDFYTDDSETEDVTVTLSFADGNQIVTSASGKAMRSVTIPKPATLIPENIRAGVEIAGVVGTYGGGAEALTAPTLALEGNELVITPTAGVAETYEIYWSADANGWSLMETVNAEAGTMRVDISEYLQLGDNYFYVKACNAMTGESASVTEFVYYEYTVGELGAPTLELDDTELIITPSVGVVETYEIYWSMDGDGWSQVETVDAETGTMRVDISEYLQLGENYFTVRAKNETTGQIADVLGYVTYTKKSGLTAPTLALDGTVLVITPTAGVAENYHIYWSADSDGWSLKETRGADEAEMRVDISEYLQLGKNYFFVEATNETTNESASTLDLLCYTKTSGLTAPTLTLSGTTLSMTLGEGTAEAYELKRSADNVTYTTVGTVTLNGNTPNPTVLKPYLRVGDNYFKVRVINETTGESALSDSVYYDLKALTAPTISLSGTTLTITAGEGLPITYFVYYSEDGDGYLDATSVSANRNPTTLDVTPYLLYDKTYFIVKAVNDWTGESQMTLTSVSYTKSSDIATLYMTFPVSSFSYLLNANTGMCNTIRDGEIDGSIVSGESIGNLTPGTQILFWSGDDETFSTVSSNGCDVRIVGEGFVHITNIYGNASVELA